MAKKTSQPVPAEKDNFVNPIDADKVAENPGLLPYAHTAGGAVIRPEDKGRIQGRALSAMDEQVDMQMGQIREQIELLATQARALQDRKRISVLIYRSEMNFQPLINHVYHLYRKSDNKTVMSMVAPGEWGRSFRYEGHLATVRLLADHTWDIIEADQEALAQMAWE